MIVNIHESKVEPELEGVREVGLGVVEGTVCPFVRGKADDEWRNLRGAARVSTACWGSREAPTRGIVADEPHLHT